MAGDDCFLFLVPIGTLFTIFGFLTGRTAAMGTSDILFLLSLGLYLTVVLWLITTSAEVDTVLEDILKVVHINDGKV